MVGGQDFGFAFFGIGIAAFVCAASFAAAFALVTLPAVLIAEADQVNTAAVLTPDCLSNHTNSITRQLKLGHYH